MEKDSSSTGEFVLRLILLALGGWIVKKVMEDHAPHHDFIEADLPDLKRIPEMKTLQPKTSSLNRQLAYRQTQNKVIDVRKVVRPNPLPYHLESGWRKDDRTYQGYYRCRLGAFRGEVEESYNGDYKFYILDPPQQILNGSHKACFTNNGGNRYHVHFGVNSENLDGGIMAVERLLFQNLNGR